MSLERFIFNLIPSDNFAAITVNLY